MEPATTGYNASIVAIKRYYLNKSSLFFVFCFLLEIRGYFSFRKAIRNTYIFLWSIFLVQQKRSFLGLLGCFWNIDTKEKQKKGDGSLERDKKDCAR
jgi:hypothetical protein